MNFQTHELAITVVTTILSIAGWAYLIGELANKLAYPTLV